MCCIISGPGAQPHACSAAAEALGWRGSVCWPRCAAAVGTMAVVWAQAVWSCVWLCVHPAGAQDSMLVALTCLALPPPATPAAAQALSSAHAHSLHMHAHPAALAPYPGNQPWGLGLSLHAPPPPAPPHPPPTSPHFLHLQQPQLLPPLVPCTILACTFVTQAQTLACCCPGAGAGQRVQFGPWSSLCRTAALPRFLALEKPDLDQGAACTRRARRELHGDPKII